MAQSVLLTGQHPPIGKLSKSLSTLRWSIYLGRRANTYRQVRSCADGRNEVEV